MFKDGSLEIYVYLIISIFSLLILESQFLAIIFFFSALVLWSIKLAKEKANDKLYARIEAEYQTFGGKVLMDGLLKEIKDTNAEMLNYGYSEDKFRHLKFIYVCIKILKDIIHEHEQEKTPDNN